MRARHAQNSCSPKCLAQRESGYSNRTIASFFKMHKTTAKRIVRRWLLLGDVLCRKVGRPCVPRMHLHEQFVVIEAILANPSLTQEEIQWEIRNTTGASYELSTVWRNLKRFGISRKQVCIQIIFKHLNRWGANSSQRLEAYWYLFLFWQLSKITLQQSQHTRGEFRGTMNQYDPEMLIFIDETGFVSIYKQ